MALGLAARPAGQALRLAVEKSHPPLGIGHNHPVADAGQRHGQQVLLPQEFRRRAGQFGRPLLDQFLEVIAMPVQLLFAVQTLEGRSRQAGDGQVDLQQLLGKRIRPPVADQHDLVDLVLLDDGKERGHRGGGRGDDPRGQEAVIQHFGDEGSHFLREHLSAH